MRQGMHLEGRWDQHPMTVTAIASRAGVEGRVMRALDIVFASAALLVLLPLFGLIALGIYCLDPGPILFGQKRVGRGGRSFRCFKFRSMCVDAEARLVQLLTTDPAAREEWARDQKLKRDPRITKLGYFLRKSSMDELPQLLNVLRGEMSLVGPRPIVESEAIRYGRYISHYCSVRPGITGLWQVSGRNDVGYRRRVAMDVVYCRSRTLAFNMRILCMTLPSVMAVRGTY